MSTVANDTHLTLGGLIYPDMDQCDFTGPFEALARIPNATFHTIWKDRNPVRDLRGLSLVPDTTLTEAPPLDVLLIPGGYGQEALMRDEAILAFLRRQAESARYVFSVCTGALLCGAAGLLHGKRVTTHWTALGVLPYYGATPSEDRVVVDGKLISAGGVTSGIDGSLVLVALLRGEVVAQELQLYMAYDPQPPFNAGSPRTAPVDILRTVTQRAQDITARRLQTGREYQARTNA